METLCSTCIYQNDFSTDGMAHCGDHDQTTGEANGMLVILTCNGHTPVETVEKVEPGAPLGTRKPVPA